MNKIEKQLQELNFEFIRYVSTIYGHCNVVYCYLNKNTELIDYIGSTGDMISRLNHRNNGNPKCTCTFDKYYRKHRADYELYLLRRCNTRDEAYEYEKKFIEIIKPKFNYYLNPNNKAAHK